MQKSLIASIVYLCGTLQAQAWEAGLSRGIEYFKQTNGAASVTLLCDLDETRGETALLFDTQIAGNQLVEVSILDARFTATTDHGKPALYQRDLSSDQRKAFNHAFAAGPEIILTDGTQTIAFALDKDRPAPCF